MFRGKSDECELPNDSFCNCKHPTWRQLQECLFSHAEKKQKQTAAATKLGLIYGSQQSSWVRWQLLINAFCTLCTQHDNATVSLSMNTGNRSQQWFFNHSCKPKHKITPEKQKQNKTKAFIPIFGEVIDVCLPSLFCLSAKSGPIGTNRGKGFGK